MNIIFRVLRKSVPLIVKERMTRVFIWILGVIAYATIGFHFIEGQPWTVSLYWTFVTIGTVGYGDYSPKTTLGMFFTISVIVLGIGSFAIAIEAIVDFLLAKATDEVNGVD